MASQHVSLRCPLWLKDPASTHDGAAFGWDELAQESLGGLAPILDAENGRVGLPGDSDEGDGGPFEGTRLR